jgi:hypothetical protein
MRRYLAIAATAIALLGTVFTGTAIAATTANQPSPYCVTAHIAGFPGPQLDCTCPPGWQVEWIGNHAAGNPVCEPVHAPKPKGCRWEFPASLFTAQYYGCYCPRGWYVAYTPWWNLWSADPFCALDKK